MRHLMQGQPIRVCLSRNAFLPIRRYMRLLSYTVANANGLDLHAHTIAVVAVPVCFGWTTIALGSAAVWVRGTTAIILTRCYGDLFFLRTPLPVWLHFLRVVFARWALVRGQSGFSAGTWTDS